jgi:ferredoxin
MKKQVKKSRSSLVLSILAIAVVVLVVLFLTKPWSSNPTKKVENQTTTNHSSVTKTSPNTQSSATNSAPNSATTTTLEPSSNKVGTGTSTSSGNGNTTTTTTITTPSGDFVSAYSVDSDTPINSVCNTSPSVTCQINFTNTLSNVTESLPAEVTNSDGSTYWQGWEPQDYNITAGIWQITAVATYNGQSTTATDSMNLSVQP